MSWKPPKTDWDTNPISPRSADFNRIEGNIAFLMQEIENKKGAMVNAINAKQPLVTLESSYQDLADGINFINQNPRVANGTSTLTLVNKNTARLQITGLSFKPRKVFLRGKVNAVYGYHQDPSYGSLPASLSYDYGIVDGVLSPTTRKDIIVINGSILSTDSTSLSCSITYQNDGFTVTITGQKDISLFTDYNGYQYWFAQE